VALGFKVSSFFLVRGLVVFRGFVFFFGSYCGLVMEGDWLCAVGIFGPLADQLGTISSWELCIGGQQHELDWGSRFSVMGCFPPFPPLIILCPQGPTKLEIRPLVAAWPMIKSDRRLVLTYPTYYSQFHRSIIC